MEKEDATQLCRVCSAPSTSAHFGVDICRACAVFYKRAKTKGLRPPCRQGTGKCSITRVSENICRSCRFDKCAALGITYDGPMRLRANPPITLLRRVGKELRSMIARRRERELELIRTIDHLIVPHPREKIFIVRASASSAISTIAMEESLVFFAQAFPSLAKITDKEKELIFKDYFVKLGIVVCFYQTNKLFGDLFFVKMGSVITCHDDDVPIDFYYPDHHQNKEALVNSIRSFHDESGSALMPLFLKSALTEREFFALAALVLSEHEDLVISEYAQKCIRDIRDEILRDLQRYYQNDMGLYNFAVRIGNLMSLTHIILESQSHYKEIMRYFSTFFEVYNTDKIMNNLVL
ncbi:hypothetical protein PMAYCL1PPCAC_09500 [Pristionchus mayeri]|uniref:Nuclear receptor n=1 Tax=Pristionchus mayeri TaxID=1317129 RepID=A0AAN5CCA8_9BILA|nr:hypothetical protein PMAYCL1PPCAC_09500 [Pristionchus mayeri]